MLLAIVFACGLILVGVVAFVFDYRSKRRYDAKIANLARFIDRMGAREVEFISPDAQAGEGANDGV